MMAMPDVAVEGVRGVLLKLRTHAGLTVERLASTEVDVALLANLPAVRTKVETGTPVAQAIVDVVSGLVAGLAPTDRLIADAVLALGVVRSEVGDQPPLAALYADDLGERRQALVAGWDALHTLLGVTDVPARPTVRNLRGKREDGTLGRLAALCVGAPAPVPHPDRLRSPGQKSVAIIGSAVTDHIFAVDRIAEPNTAADAKKFERRPGGKGLNLAFAAARMDLDAQLFAAIGGDDDAQQILDYMRQRGLRTDLVKQVPDATTPVTGMLVTGDGTFTAYGWKNADFVRHTEGDLRSARSLVRDADAVLITFEPSLDEVRWALDAVPKSTKKPIVLLQPSPPTDSPELLYRQLSAVDYLVGSEWELRQLSGVDDRFDFDHVAGRLFNAGVKAVCAVEKLRCRIRTAGMRADVRAPEVLLSEAPAAREAFSAALIRQLLADGPELTIDMLEWAAAAMATNKSPDDINAMPTPADVNNLIESARAWS